MANAFIVAVVQHVAFIYVLLSILNISNLSFCYFELVHGSHSGYKLIKIRGWNISYSLKSVYVKDREFYKDITMERNRRKKYINIDCERVTNEIFAILYKIVSGTEKKQSRKANSRQYTRKPSTSNTDVTAHVEGEILGIDERSAKKVRNSLN